MTGPIYAIGDIHGQMAMLETVLAQVERDGGANATIVFLGDYTDRGPDSKAVIDTLIQGKNNGRDWVFIKGNHDRMFEWFLQTPSRADPYMYVNRYWLHERLGGDTTLQSYGVQAGPRERFQDVHQSALEMVPRDHRDFFKNLTLTYETDDLFFTHAGIRPGVALGDQSEEDLLWIREEFHDYTKPHAKLIVHGHTPIEQATHYGNRINLDTGAGYGHALTAAVFDGGDCFVLTDAGRLALSVSE